MNPQPTQLPDILKQNLVRLLQQNGAALCGVADLNGFVASSMTTGISVAIPVPVNIVEDLKTAPTREYHDMYYTLNQKLNDIVTAGADFLIRQGYQAFANTTDVVKYNEEWQTPLPHKTVATRAGLGWIGKSCLLVTPEYGSAIRLSSLITNAPLPYDTPITQSRCGSCTQCVQHCPAKALTGALWTAGMPREELFQREICKKVQTERMKAATGIETDLCGMCFAVCPYTNRYLKKCHKITL